VNSLRVFDDEWAELAPRLSMMLAAKGVHAQDREDLLQETALRLYRVWEKLATDQPVWPFAVTIALNLWRDQLRAAVVRQRDVLTANLTESVGEAPATSDVERTVLARHELAQVGAVMRELGADQRWLLLANDELHAVVAPLRPAERMARMRARRELARLVGRASAAVALLWWRRPVRANALAAAACAGVLAVGVMSGAPYTIAQVPAPHAEAGAATAPRIAAPTRPGVAVALKRTNVTRTKHAQSLMPSDHGSGIATVPPTSVCATSGSGQPPHIGVPPGSAQQKKNSVVSVGSVGVYHDDGSGPQPIIETPPMSADDGGCVYVG